MPFCNVDVHKHELPDNFIYEHEPDLILPGPRPWYMNEIELWNYGHPPRPELEIWISLNTDLLEAKPFALKMNDDGSGIGVEGGYDLDGGLPIKL